MSDETEAQIRNLQIQLVAQAEGRAQMWLMLANLRDGHVPTREQIVRLIGEGELPTDFTPEREAIENRRQLAAGRNAWREAYMQASRDADLMAVIVGSLELKDDQINMASPLTLDEGLWTEMQQAVARSRDRTTGV